MMIQTKREIATIGRVKHANVLRLYEGVYNWDLKPENLLLDENSVLKIADFRFSTVIESHRYNMLQTMCGTPMYVAPYVLRGKGFYGEKADVWS
ncbi:CBL-interacting kinase [Medicago truncatula]|uniref:CBL-interacting kinase n=1 Tax=Medicago truncatula TaxID=3880 RepID=A0A072UUX3_MEDTR|nr:CBL-interacting kinase [Medicago truncatula]